MQTTTNAQGYRDHTNELVGVLQAVLDAVLRVGPDVALFTLFCVVWALVFILVLH